MAKRKRGVSYRNIKDGRVVERPAGRDEWLEGSPVWERIPAAELERKDTDERTED